MTTNYVPRLKNEFDNSVSKSLMNEFSYKTTMQVPRIIKIILSRGVGAAVADKKLVDQAVDELTLISGQKAVPTLSKKDVASFKLRKGMPIGAKVTLRGNRMFEFLGFLLIALFSIRETFEICIGDSFSSIPP